MEIMCYLPRQMRISSLAMSLIAALALGAGGCKKKEAAPPAPVAGETKPEPVAVVDAAPPPPPSTPDAPPLPDASATVEDPLKAICPQLLAKITECSEDKEFEKALKEGADAKQQKVISKLIAGISEWPVAPCANLAASYEHEGFLDRWKELSDPKILESCAALGAAVRGAGGLFGGDSAN